MIKMVEKKQIIIGVSVLFLIIIILSVLLINNLNQKPTTSVYFTPEPETWIEQDRSSENTGDYSININKATKTLSIFDGRRQEYYYYGKRLTFFSHGYYEGNAFTEAYVDPVIYQLGENMSVNEQLALAKKYSLIRISPDMNPNDEIMDGFILAKVEGEEFGFYIFLDNDWKNKMPETNILWANDLTDPDYINYRAFDFSDEKDGIYIDKVSFNADWFKKNTNGGIFVGDINPETLKIKSQKDLNATFIYIQ